MQKKIKRKGKKEKQKKRHACLKRSKDVKKKRVRKSCCRLGEKYLTIGESKCARDAPGKKRVRKKNVSETPGGMTVCASKKREKTTRPQVRVLDEKD